jgi:hypothetical protein
LPIRASTRCRAASLIAAGTSGRWRRFRLMRGHTSSTTQVLRISSERKTRVCRPPDFIAKTACFSTSLS